MNRLYTSIEFFVYETEVWCRNEDGSIQQISESNIELTSHLCEYISTFYPKAFEALQLEYAGCRHNIPYFRFRIVARFIKCNFATLDHIPDIDKHSHCNFEAVPCPLRGECPNDHIICRPQFNNYMSAAEFRVMAMLFDGLSEDYIAKQLSISPHTVHNHIRNAYARLDVHSRAEFVKFAAKNNLFS